MNGKTHEMIGLTASMFAMHDQPIETTLIGCVVALTTSTLPDLDILDNRKGKGFEMFFDVVRQSIIYICIAIYNDSKPYQIVVWLSLMVFLVLQPHRGFSHSIWSLGIVTGLFIWMCGESLVWWLVIPYTAHLVTDLLNTKKVSIFYPSGFCLGWVKAGGMADNFLGFLFGVVAVILIGCKIYGFDLVERVVRMM